LIAARVLFLGAFVLLPLAARAQTPAQTSTALASNASPAQENTVSPLPSPPSNYAYASEGRRDPFVPTVGRGPVVSTTTGVIRPPGIAGLMVAEIAVRGILESQGTWIAMVRAADGRTYTVRAGDRLMDGVVRSIAADVVVILQEVRDPLSTATQREVRKLLRGGEQVQ
jgi:Tfp pilus assembly protein PilP